MHILRGCPIYLVDGRRYHLQPGSIHFAKPGAHEEYLWDHQSSTLHSYIHFNFDCLPDDIPPLAKWPQIHEQAAAVLRYTMEQIVAQLVQGRGQPTALSPAFCRLFEVFVSLYNQHIDTRIQLESELPSAIQKSLFAMRESIDHAQTGMIDLQSLAQQAAVSPGHLCKVFQRHLGRSPMQVYWLLQLQFSLSLLIRSGLSIQEIAWRCDFSDPSTLASLRKSSESRRREYERSWLQGSPRQKSHCRNKSILRVHGMLRSAGLFYHRNSAMRYNVWSNDVLVSGLKYPYGIKMSPSWGRFFSQDLIA